MMLDYRLHAYRSDLADDRLRGRVEAQRFVVGTAAQIMVPTASVLAKPSPQSRQATQALLGETVTVFESANGLSWVQLNRDGYVGYVHDSALSSSIVSPTHRVRVPLTMIYPEADLKTRPVTFIPLNAEVAVASLMGEYLALQGGGYVFAKHLVPVSHHENDFVNVAERFLGVPYYWGGKTVQGTDCSGLVQSALHACGIASLRDTDMQEKTLGVPVTDNALRRGDLIYWAGHVGIMHDDKNLLHANGHHMMTVIEPLQDVIARSEASGKPVTSIRRLADTI